MAEVGLDFMVRGGKDCSCLRSMETYWERGDGREWEAKPANEKNQIRVEKQQRHSYDVKDSVDLEHIKKFSKQTLKHQLVWMVPRDA